MRSRTAPADVHGPDRGLPTFVLLGVHRDDGPDAADFPGYMFASDHYGGGLVTPPRQYPDGRWYLKCAGGELVDDPDAPEPRPQLAEQLHADARGVSAELAPISVEAVLDEAVIGDLRSVLPFGVCA